MEISNSDSLDEEEEDDSREVDDDDDVDGGDDGVAVAVDEGDAVASPLRAASVALFVVVRERRRSSWRRTLSTARTAPASRFMRRSRSGAKSARSASSKRSSSSSKSEGPLAPAARRGRESVWKTAPARMSRSPMSAATVSPARATPRVSAST